MRVLFIFLFVLQMVASITQGNFGAKALMTIRTGIIFPTIPSCKFFNQFPFYTSDCTDLPNSMSKNHNFPKGCPGAVWSNGKPSRKYCRGKGKSKVSYPWWKTCCIWSRSRCIKNPKYKSKASSVVMTQHSTGPFTIKRRGKKPKLEPKLQLEPKLELKLEPKLKAELKTNLKAEI